MSGGESSDNVVLAAQQLKVIGQIADLAVDQVDGSYGTGWPHFDGGRKVLAYHNGHHTRFIRAGFGWMAAAIGLSPTETAVGDSAAASHDIIQLKPRGVMERESAEWLEEQLKRKQLPDVVIAMGRPAILGTEPIIQGKKMIGQMATRLSYPSKPAQEIALSVACADMGEIHSPMGPYFSHQLYKEIKGAGNQQDPPFEDFLTFVQGQAVLAEEYKYPHPKGEKVFGRRRRAVVAHQKRLAIDIERGEVTTWQEVIRRDLEFARQQQ